MPKVPSFPTILDGVKTISIGKLNRDNCIVSGSVFYGTISWTYESGETTASINIQVNEPDGYVLLDYTYDGEPIHSKIKFISTPSNLGKGKVYYFICPKTDKRCLKLYLIDKHFVHRETFTNCMYSVQTKSKLMRFLDDNYGPYFKVDKLYEDISKKHFKKTYADKPTKKYLKIMKEIKKGECISWHHISNLLKCIQR